MIAEDAEDALLAAGKRLREVDPERYRRILALMRAFVSCYDRELESPEMIASRHAEISPRRRVVN